jgi:single-stranded DNA-specific DHH superfamily exonuclease
MVTRFEQALEFLRNIKPSDGVVIIYNDDADGICSCVIIRKYLASVGVEPYIIAQPMPPDKQLLRRVQSGAPNKIIWLDMAIDQTPTLVQRMASFAEQLVVDHHVILNDLSKIKNVIHHNPRFKQKGMYQSTTYLAWKLAAELLKDDLVWIAGIGAVADYDLRWSRDLVEEFDRRWGMATFQKLANMMESVCTTKALGYDQLVERLLKAEGPEELLEDEVFKKSDKSVQAEIDSALADAETSGELVNGIFFYQPKTKYNIKSAISGKLSERWPNRLIFVYGKVNNNINASVRSAGGRYNLSIILKDASKGIKGASAGGHEAAGGGTIPFEEWEDFKLRLIDAAAKYKKEKGD